jgi:hypothetical protein
MSHVKSKEVKKVSPVFLTEAEARMIMAYRSTTGGGAGAAAPVSAPAPAPASHGEWKVKHSNRSGPRTGGGAGAGSRTGGATASERPARDSVSEETINRVKTRIDEIDLSMAKNFTELMALKANGVHLYYMKLHPDSSGSFRCMAGEVHADAIKHFMKELDAPVFVIIKFLMLKLYAWVKDKNESILAEMKTNSHWYNCFPENAVKNAEVVFMKDRTKILVGKNPTASADDE